jgi:hypothetical protein
MALTADKLPDEVVVKEFVGAENPNGRNTGGTKIRRAIPRRNHMIGDKHVWPRVDCLFDEPSDV